MIRFNVNNRRTLTLQQTAPSAAVEVTNGENQYSISAGDFVMLLNLYRYVKDNDIQDDFINPYGKNRE